MDSSNLLKTLLQLQLATDSSAVLHLPSILSSLNAEVLQPSSHTKKWTTRVNSLIHSKDAGARWAGLCIAQRTSIYSKPLMLECAQGWVTVVLPLLAVRMSTPVCQSKRRSYLLYYIRKMRGSLSSKQPCVSFKLCLLQPWVSRSSNDKYARLMSQNTRLRYCPW